MKNIITFVDFLLNKLEKADLEIGLGTQKIIHKNPM